MKRILLPLTLLLLAVVACDKTPKEEPKFTFALTNSMVQVGNVSEAPMIQVDNSKKTVYIEVAYADKSELSALPVSFTGLPSDVTANPATSTFNYAGGAAQTVTFTQGTLSESYSISAAATAPDPHFVSMKLNGVEVSGGSAKLKGSSDLKNVSVEFVVSPENTVVKLNGETITSATEEAPNAIDFSDKMNGVTFTLVCDEVEKTQNVKVVTTGINSVERVWGRYVKPVTAGADLWWTEVIPASNQNMRTMAMDKKNIYLATTGKKLYSVSISDPTSVKEMDMGDYAAGGVFGSCALATMPNGDGHVILLSNMVNSTASEFVIWKWDSADGKPEKVLSYKLPEAARIGDQMSVEGDWKSGKIWFHDFTSQQAAYVFTVTDGTISTTATKVSYDAKQGNWSAMYKYDDKQYIGGGPGAKSRLFELSGDQATTKLELPGAYFANPLHGIRFFTFNEQEYMTYVVLRNSFQDGQVRFTELNGENLQSSLENPGATLRYGLGDPVENDITADKNGNGLGNNVLQVIDGKIYVASYVPGAGLSLFLIK